MLVNIEEMGLSELDSLFEKVVNSMMSDNEKFVLYDAIDERRQKLKLETAEACIEGADFE